MKRIAVFALVAFVLALFLGAAVAMAQEDPGGMSNTPGGESNTPSGTSNSPSGYERRAAGVAGTLLAQEDGVNPMGQQGPGMSNSTGLPSLSGDYSSTFESGDTQSAQQVCDEVARANNKTGCQAASVTTQGSNVTPPRHLYYCVCK